MLDQYGNLVTADNSDRISMAIAGGPGSWTSNSTTSGTVSNGVASFSNLVLTTAGTYTLNAAASGLASATSNSFKVSAASASQLSFLVQPSHSMAGSAISPAVQLQLLDQFGNLVDTDNSDQVALTANGPGSLAGSSTTKVTASSGVAVFSNLVLNTTGDYTLSAAATGLSGTTSTSFTIGVATATKLAFTVSPSNTTAGSAISPAVQVQVLDQYGNLVSTDNSDQISVTVASGPGSWTGTSTTSGTVSGGVATFSNLVLTKAGSYTLQVSVTGSPSLTAPSNPFVVNPAVPSQVSFGGQPSNVSAGSAINPAVQVQLSDQYGNVVSTDNSDQVSVAVATGPGSWTASSSPSVRVTSGVANFSNLVLTTAGPYTLSASVSGLSSVISTGFSVGFASASQLFFKVQPSNTTAGSAISPAVQVQVMDQFGNLVSTDSSDQVSMTANGPGSWTGSSTTKVTVSSGVATFSNLAPTKVGSYTLSTTVFGLSGATSNAFNVGAAAASTLSFSQQPSDANAGAALSPAVQVQLFDKYGNPETTDNSDQVNMTVASGTGSWTSNSTTGVTFSGGIATFSNLMLTKAGSYTLKATVTGSPSLTATSYSFGVSAASASQLSLSGQPGGAIAGSPISPTVQVQVLDSYGNLLSSDYTDQISVTAASGPGSLTSNSTTTVRVSGGVATFSNLILTKVGTYTLSANAPGCTCVTSTFFGVGAASAFTLSFTVQPGNGTAGSAINPAVQVQVQDQFGNLVSTDNTDKVTITNGNPSGSFSSNSITTVKVSGGVATFSNLVPIVSGTYTLFARVSSLSSNAISTSFVVSAASASKLFFSIQPGNMTAGLTNNPVVQVQVQDPFGNLVSSDNTDQIMIGIASGPASFTEQHHHREGRRRRGHL